MTKEKFARNVSEERGRKRKQQNRQPELNKNKKISELRRRLRILKIVIHKDLPMKKMWIIIWNAMPRKNHTIARMKLCW